MNFLRYSGLPHLAAKARPCPAGSGRSNLQAMTILVTGAAGFLGMHVAKRLLQRGERVVGVDNMDAYYSLELKEARLAELEEDANFTFHYLDIGDAQAASAVFALYPDLEGIVHLAAQVGVGHSLANPRAFLNTN